MERESYTAVERAHIVPRMYQKAFSVSGQVAVHTAGRSTCRQLTTRKAGTRNAFYRRTRPAGEAIDDVEASLASVEQRAAPALHAMVRGDALTLEIKAAMAQFFGVQLMRGPAFFDFREELLTPMIEELDVATIRPRALAEAGGDVSVVRQKVLDAYLDPTQRLMTMLQKAIKVAGVLGNMRWHVLRFREPVIAYSDHPVVVWPVAVTETVPFDRQHFGPLSAIEVRVPVSPERALLMNWLDLPDAPDIALERGAAAELNAFTVGQSEKEWMHMPGHEPPIASGPLLPLSRVIASGYRPEFLLSSQRRKHAEAWLKKNQNRQWVNDLKLLDLGPLP